MFVDGFGEGLGPHATVGNNEFGFNTYVASALSGDLNQYGKFSFLPKKVLVDNRGYTYSISRNGRVVPINVPGVSGLEDLQIDPKSGLIDEADLPDNTDLEIELLDPSKMNNSVKLPSNILYDSVTDRFYSRSDSGIISEIDRKSTLQAMIG